MWITPRTLFWPLMGWDFEKLDIAGYLKKWFQLLMSERVVAIAEIIGFIITVWAGLLIISKKQVTALLKTGKIR
jgi:hypothetical protein